MRAPIAFRLWRCLRFIATYPGASNRQVAWAAGVRDPRQMSRLGMRLLELDLAVRVAGNQNAWVVTPRGKRVLSQLEHNPAEDAAQLLSELERDSRAQRRPAWLQ